jgi:hypothetical protein
VSATVQDWSALIETITSAKMVHDVVAIALKHHCNPSDSRDDEHHGDSSVLDTRLLERVVSLYFQMSREDDALERYLQSQPPSARMSNDTPRSATRPSHVPLFLPLSPPLFLSLSSSLCPAPLFASLVLKPR